MKNKFNLGIQWCLFLLTSVLLHHSLVGQKISHVDYTVVDKKIKVNYHLEDCLPKMNTNIKLTFVDDKGQTIVPKTIYGDINGVGCGNQKQITWDVLADQMDLRGKYAAKLDVVNYNTATYNSINAIKRGGASNAFLSILVPGLGDYFVDDIDATISPSFVTSIVYGSLLVGGIYKLASASNYEKYRESKVQNDIDKYYSNANEFNRIGNAWLQIGLGIWAWDVLYVFFKGNSNTARQNKLVKWMDKNKFSVAFKNSDQFQINYSLHF